MNHFYFPQTVQIVRLHVHVLIQLVHTLATASCEMYYVQHYDSFWWYDNVLIYFGGKMSLLVVVLLPRMLVGEVWTDVWYDLCFLSLPQPYMDLMVCHRFINTSQNKTQTYFKATWKMEKHVNDVQRHLHVLQFLYSEIVYKTSGQLRTQNKKTHFSFMYIQCCFEVIVILIKTVCIHSVCTWFYSR